MTADLTHGNEASSGHVRPRCRWLYSRRMNVRRVREEEFLTLGIHREEAANHGARATLCAAVAGPRGSVEGVQAVVNRDLLALLDRSPSEDRDAMSHRVRVTGVVEVTAGWREDSEPVERELTQVDPVPLRGSSEFCRREGAGMATAKDELAFVECSPHV